MVIQTVYDVMKCYQVILDMGLASLKSLLILGIEK